MNNKFSDEAFVDFTEKVLSLSYEQKILFLKKLIESLRSKCNVTDYTEMENDITKAYMKTMWEEVKNDKC